MSDLPYLHGGGAAKAVKSLFAGLVGRGHHCVAVTRCPSEDHIFVEGVRCIRTQFLEAWVDTLFREDHPPPDIIITQLAGDSVAIGKAEQYNIPSILVIPSFSEYFCLNTIGFSSCDRHCLESIPCGFRVHRGELQRATVIVTSSKYAADVAKQFSGRDAMAVYPWIDLREHLVPATGDCITLAAGHPAKGLDLVLDIISTHRAFSYIILRDDVPLPTWVSECDVRLLGNVVDMKPVWQSTKVLLVPSILAESFGRVCIEAAANGIPVITSGRGGLDEAAPPGSVVPIERPDLWKEEVLRLMTDADYYRERSKQAKAYAHLFTLVEQVDLVEDLANLLVKRSDPTSYIVTLNRITTNIQPHSTSKLSVVTSAYKSAPYLEGYFADLRRQTFQNFEVVLICNDPTRVELDIIDCHKREFDIHVIKVPREDTAASWNRAIDVATGDYITIANVDDQHKPYFFHKHLIVLDTRPDISLVYNDYVDVTSEGVVIDRFPTPDFSIDALKMYCYTGPHVTFRKSVVKEVGYFDTSFSLACDYEYWLRLATRGYQFFRIPLPLSSFLRRDDSLTASNMSVMVVESSRAQEMYR